MHLYKRICLIFLIFTSNQKYYLASQHENSVFPVCFLTFKAADVTISKQINHGSFGRNFSKEQARDDALEILDHLQVKKSCLRSFLQGTAFYIGDGCFVTNFHLLIGAGVKDDTHLIMIKYKDKIIDIDQILHYDSLNDLLVLHSSSSNLQSLKPLKVILSQNNNQNKSLSVFDYEKNLLVEIFFSLDGLLGNVFRNINPRSHKLKDGMSGSPLLEKGQVVGILWGAEVSTGYFTDSLHLLRLLDRKKNNCSVNECLFRGINDLRLRSELGDVYAFMKLKISLRDLFKENLLQEKEN